MGIKYTNNAEGLLSGNMLDSDLTLTLQNPAGTYFPEVVAASGDYFYATIVDTSGNLEIIKVTEHVADSNTFQAIERAAEGIRNQAGVALAFSTGDKVQARIIKKILDTDIYLLDDSEVITFGAGPDAKMYSDGTNLLIRNGADDETLASFTQDGAAKLFYNGSTKFQTTNTGGTITGILATSGVTVAGNADVVFGNGPDAQVGWSTTELQIKNGAGTEIMAAFVPDGAARLYFNNSSKFATSNTGATLTGVLICDGLTMGDTEVITFGAGPDAQIGSNGSALVVLNGAGTETMAVFNPNADVTLYHNNAAKFATTVTGATLTGILVTDGVTLGDNEDITFGAGPDGKISSNGTALVVENGAGNETMATFTQNAGVALYYDNSKKLETTTTGATLTGVLVADGMTLGDNEGIVFGGGVDAQIMSTGTWLSIMNGAGTEEMARFTQNGAVNLFHNNVHKFGTSTKGVSVEGAISIKEVTTPAADAGYGQVYTKADNKLYFQDGAGVEHELAFA